MQIEGFRIQLTGVASGWPRLGRGRASGENRRADSADTGSLAWLVMDPEPDRAASAALRAAVAEGSYWVPAEELGRSIVAAHVWIRP